MEVKKSKKADLENKKGLFVQLGLIAALLLMIFAFEWSTTEKEQTLVADNRQIIEEEEMPITEDTPPEPEQVAPPPIISDDLNIVDDDVDIQTDLDFTSEDDKQFAVEQVAYVEKKEVEVEEEVEEDIPFALVEDKPMFQGGDQNTFRNWVMKNINYPESAAENGVEGKVYVRFKVDKDGSVKDIKVMRKVDPALDKEAVRVISQSPKWTPGKQRNKPVAVIFDFPVHFQLAH